MSTRSKQGCSVLTDIGIILYGEYLATIGHSGVHKSRGWQYTLWKKHEALPEVQWRTPGINYRGNIIYTEHNFVGALQVNSYKFARKIHHFLDTTQICSLAIWHRANNFESKHPATQLKVFPQPGRTTSWSTGGFGCCGHACQGYGGTVGTLRDERWWWMDNWSMHHGVQKI